MRQKTKDKDAVSFLHQLGKKIKTEREKAGLTQEKMAELIGSDYKYLQRIEYGEVNITIKTLLKIASSLNLPPEKLFKTDK